MLEPVYCSPARGQAGFEVNKDGEPALPGTAAGGRTEMGKWLKVR